MILIRPHMSLLDGPFVAWKLRGEACVFPVDSDYARHPLWGPLLRAYGWLLGHRIIALDVTRPAAIRAVPRALAAGETVVLFPQGTGLRDPARRDMPGVRWLLRRSSACVEEFHLLHWRGVPTALFVPDPHAVAAIPSRPRERTPVLSRKR